MYACKTWSSSRSMGAINKNQCMRQALYLILFCFCVFPRPMRLHVEGFSQVVFVVISSTTVVEENRSSSVAQVDTLFDTNAPAQLTYPLAGQAKLSGSGRITVRRPAVVTLNTDVLLFLPGAGRELSLRGRRRH